MRTMSSATGSLSNNKARLAIKVCDGDAEQLREGDFKPAVPNSRNASVNRLKGRSSVVISLRGGFETADA